VKNTNAKIAKLLAKLEKASVIGCEQNKKQLVFPTGIDAVDHYLFACGGVPAGTRSIVELYGGEGSFKSSFADTIIANTQRNGGYTFLADSEHSRNEVETTQRFGVDFAALGQYLKDTDDESMEKLLGRIEFTLDALAGEEPGALIVWDSFAGTPTREEIANGASPDKVRDVRAGVISRALRVLVPKLALANSSLLIINQPRTKIGVKFGNPTTTPGGQAIKSTASLRVQFWASTAVKSGDQVVGRLITAATDKTRFSPRRKCSLRFDFDGGFSDEWTTLNLAKDLGLVEKGAKGAKALQQAIDALGRQFPGFARQSAVKSKQRDERADKLADLEAKEHHEAIVSPDGDAPDAEGDE